MIDFNESLFDESLDGWLTLTLSGVLTKQGCPVWGCQVLWSSHDNKECRLFCVFVVFYFSPPQSQGSCVVWHCSVPVTRAPFSLQAKNSIQASLSPQHWWILVPIDDFAEACSWMGGAHYKGPLIHLLGLNSLDTQAQRLGVRLHFRPGAACSGFLVGKCVNDTDWLFHLALE